MFGSLTASDWIAMASLVVAAVSLFVAVVSFVVARKTLIDAEEYWKQQKWFDLYAKSNQAYDDLQLYRVKYKGTTGLLTQQQGSDWNQLMISMRSLHAMVMVFPVCPVTVW